MSSLILIAVIVVCITNSRLFEIMEAGIGKWLKCNVKLPVLIVSPFSLTHLAGLVWLFGNGITLRGYALLLIICTFTPIADKLLRKIREIIMNLIDRI